MNLKEAKISKISNEADLLEMRLRRERGELLSKDEVAHAQRDFIRMLRDRLLSFPARTSDLIAGELNYGDARRLNVVLEKYIQELLNELPTDPESVTGPSEAKKK